MGLLITDPNAGGGGGVSENTDVAFKKLVLTPDALTGSAATSALDISQTWNTTGNPTALKVNVTNTASGASALLMDLQVGGVSAFSVSKNGSVTATSAGSVFSRVDFADRWVAGNCHATGGQLNVGSGDVIGWSSNNFWHGSLDVILKRAAAATLQLGEDHATAPVAQFLQGPAATSGDNWGGDLTLRGGAPSGTGWRGTLRLQSGTTGTTVVYGRLFALSTASLQKAAFSYDERPQSPDVEYIITDAISNSGQVTNGGGSYRVLVANNSSGVPSIIADLS